MKIMGSRPCSRGGVLLFLLLQISLPLSVRGEETTTTASTDSTANTEVTSDSSTLVSGLTSTSMSPDTTLLTTANMSISVNFTVPGPNSTNMSMIYCQVLTCNASQCYDKYLNTNATMCPDNFRFCELRRDDPMRYSVNCASSCPNICNGSQINCSIACCDSEFCMNSTLANLTNIMPMIPTTPPATTNTTTTTTTMTTTTPANNGKKCHKTTCNGDTCYQTNSALMLCPPTQHYCMLKKTTSGTVITWTAGCSEDCRKETACSSTTTTCFLECCNATTTASCLKMSGALNMPSSATRGLLSPMLLIISSLLFWLLSMVTSA